MAKKIREQEAKRKSIEKREKRMMRRDRRTETEPAGMQTSESTETTTA